MLKFVWHGLSTPGMPLQSFNSEATCVNCGGSHKIDDCEHPSYILPCYRCFVYSLNGSGHKSPCAPINTVSDLRTDIFGRKPLAMFKLRILKQDCDLYFLNELSGQFENLEPGKYLLGPTLHGIFSYKSMENHNIVSYDASAFERLSIMIAVHSEGRWRLRFRLVATNESGLIGFRMSSTLHKQNGRYILPYDQHNNVLILGIQPKEPSFKILFRIFANENGVIDDRIFSGYQAFATYDPTTMKGNFVLDDELDGETAKSKRYFNKHLYPQHSAPIESRT